jgi:hypothetical protein
MLLKTMRNSLRARLDYRSRTVLDRTLHRVGFAALKPVIHFQGSEPFDAYWHLSGIDDTMRIDEHGPCITG